MSTMIHESSVVNAAEPETVADAILARGLAIARHEADHDHEEVIEGEPHDWPAWTDADLWQLGPGPDEPADEPESYPSLDAWVDAQADRYDALGTPAADLLAGELRAIAFKVRLTGATTVAEYRARVEQLDEDSRESWRSAGYLDGLADGRVERAREPVGTFGHPA
jgi:hypothetical protein